MSAEQDCQHSLKEQDANKPLKEVWLSSPFLQEKHKDGRDCLCLHDYS